MDKFMQAALQEAQQGWREEGIPIGSVLVKDGQIIGRGHNRRVQNGDPTAHAEIDCLRMPAASGITAARSFTQPLCRAIIVLEPWSSSASKK